MKHVWRVRSRKLPASSFFCLSLFFLPFVLPCAFAYRLPPVSTMAEAPIVAKSGSSLSGTALFIHHENSFVLSIKLKNAPPGLHGVHLHEKGDCSDPLAKSAGDHYNPTHQIHGHPTKGLHHVGDFGNIKVKADGTGTLTFREAISNEEGHPILPALFVLQKSIVIHEKADDFKTQPTGNSGARIGCGVFVVKDPDGKFVDSSVRATHQTSFEQ